MHILNSLINWLYLFFLDVCVWVRAVGGDETADHLSFYSYIRLGETCGEMMLANAKLIDDGVRRQWRQPRPRYQQQRRMDGRTYDQQSTTPTKAVAAAVGCCCDTNSFEIRFFQWMNFAQFDKVVRTQYIFLIFFFIVRFILCLCVYFADCQRLFFCINFSFVCRLFVSFFPSYKVFLAISSGQSVWWSVFFLYFLYSTQILFI